MTQVKTAQSDIMELFRSNFALFEEHLDGDREIALHKIRKKAMDNFMKLGFPTQRHEEWKYTNIKPILKHEFQLPLVTIDAGDQVSDHFRFENLDEQRLTLINGHLLRPYSGGTDRKGVVVKSLRDALRENRELIDRHLARHAGFDDDTFVSLNTAFTHDGLFIYLPENTELERPIHLANVSFSDGSPVQCHPRNLIIFENNASGTIVESYQSQSDSAFLSNSVMELVIGENASVNHIKIQNENEKSYHIATRQVVQAKNSHYASVGIDLGSAISRNNLNILLNDEYCESHLYGFYMGNGRQVIDNHTLIDHARANCESNELYKGILDDRATGVFNGKVMVRQDAQKTNAFQSNKALLLTNDATMNAKPQLEIFADDVKCSHGATIGQLDEEALFYLRTRGISKENANAMLRFAFASDVLDKIMITPVRLHLNRMITRKFKLKDDQKTNYQE